MTYGLYLNVIINMITQLTFFSKWPGAWSRNNYFYFIVTVVFFHNLILLWLVDTNRIEDQEVEEKIQELGDFRYNCDITMKQIPMGNVNF